MLSCDVGTIMYRIYLSECTPRVPIDIIFGVDSAGIGASNTKFVLEFVANVSSHLNMDSGDTTIGLLSNGCSDDKLEEVPSSDPNQLKEVLSKYKSPKLDQLMRNLRLKAGDGRMQSKHVGIAFVSDRLSSYELRKSSLEVRRAKFQNIGIFVVGIGDRVQDSQLESLITDNAEYFRVFSFESLADIGNALLYRICLYGSTN